MISEAGAEGHLCMSVQMAVKPVVVAAVPPLSLPSPTMDLPPVSLPSLQSSGLAPLPQKAGGAQCQPSAPFAGEPMQMQLPQMPGALGGGPLGPPVGVPLQPAAGPPLPPLPQPIQALTLPPNAMQLPPAVAPGPAQVPAGADTLGRAPPPLHGRPVAFQPVQQEPVLAAQHQMSDMAMQQQRQPPVLAATGSPGGGFREAADRAKSAAAQLPAVPVQSAFAASAAFPAVPSRNVLQASDPNERQVLACSQMRPGQRFAACCLGGSRRGGCDGAVQEQNSGSLSQRSSGAYLTPHNSVQPPRHGEAASPAHLQSMPSGGARLQQQGTPRMPRTSHTSICMQSETSGGLFSRWSRSALKTSTIELPRCSKVLGGFVS